MSLTSILANFISAFPFYLLLIRSFSEISQLWSEDVNLTFFIHYHSDTHESLCEAIPDFSYEDTITKDLVCYDGWTDVGIFIYFDDELSLEECEECRPPDSDEESVVAYYFEVSKFFISDYCYVCCVQSSVCYFSANKITQVARFVCDLLFCLLFIASLQTCLRKF